MFATNTQEKPLEFPLSVHRGEVAIKISAAVIDKLSIPFKHALVGKFSQGRPTLEETRKTLSKLDLKSALEVGLIDYRHVLLRFHSEADFHRIWTRGIWQIGKYPMRVFKWSPSFQTSKETSIVPVWFELPGLPFHLFDHGVLFSIMKAVGVPLSVDAATLNLTRPSVARVNVEIDLLRELPSRIWIEHGDDGEGFWQRIIPENLPHYCTSCFRQGHSHAGCNMNVIGGQKIWKFKAPTVVNTKPSTSGDAGASNPLLLENSPTSIGVGETVTEDRRGCATAAHATPSPTDAAVATDADIGPSISMGGGETVVEERRPSAAIPSVAPHAGTVDAADIAAAAPLAMDAPSLSMGGGEKVVVQRRPSAAGEILRANDMAAAASPDVHVAADPSPPTEGTMAVHGAESSDKQKHKAPNVLTPKPSKPVAKPMLLDIDPFMDIAAAPFEASATKPRNGAGDSTEEVYGAAKCGHPKSRLHEVSPADAESPDLVGESVEFVRDPGQLMIPPSWKKNNPRIAPTPCVLAAPTIGDGDKLELSNAAGHFVGSEPTFEDGDKLEFVRGHADLSGKKKVSTILEGGAMPYKAADLVVVSGPKIGVGNNVENVRAQANYTGQQKDSTELERNLFLVPSTLTTRNLTQVSEQKIFDWDYMFQKISRNIRNCSFGAHENLSSHTQPFQHTKLDTFSPSVVNVGVNIIMKDGLLNSETNCLAPTAITELPLIENDKDLVIGLESCDTIRQEEFPDNVRVQLDESGLQPSLGLENDRFASLNNSWQNLVSPNVAPGEFVDLEQMGEASHSGREFSEAEQFEIEKKRKPGVSDRVLRSMLHASNSDPSRPSSL